MTTKFQHAGLDWIPHTPGDPMPCEEEKSVRFLQRWELEGHYADCVNMGKNCIWKKIPLVTQFEIIGWNYAD